MYLINTFLGFLIAQIYDILKRKKQGENSPKPFDVVFFVKDTWQKIALSLLLSVGISVAIHLNWGEVLDLFGTDWKLNNLVYLAVGAVPELVLQYVKKKYGFLQPENVEGFKRKTNQ